MATLDQAEHTVTRVLVALNAAENLGIDWQAIAAWRQAAKDEGRQITEEEMKAYAMSLVSD